ncbi:unnamed protein product [Penicillium salamii]|nr:unnamed protein product [Penicillium salamii]
MSFYTMRPVTSSATLLLRAKPSVGPLRTFSSYGNALSSKRDMQTATAYRPHTLPSSFPPPRSSGGADTSISAEFPLPESQPTQRTSQNTAPSLSVREGEAQKSKTSFSASPAAPKTSPKPRRPLRPRKAAMKLSAVATEQLRKLMAQPEPKFIRVGVKNRGCSGLAYHLEYVEQPGKFDEVVEQDGVKVLIDSKALFSIIGSEMDWHEDKLSRRFVFRNPNINTPSLRGNTPTMSSHFASYTSEQGYPLLIAVRFSASIPDLRVDVPEPETTTGAGLKQLIRAELPKDLSTHRLRLIYAGRGLEDTAALTASLKLPTPPRSSPAPEDNGKGKQAVHDDRPRIYIHCSIGDIALSETDLANEASVSSTLQRKSTATPIDEADERSPLVSHEPQTTPAPRGFDRLLAAGFTATEVTALRSQFLAMQSVSRTRDTMPSGEQLRELEDRWMDEGSTAVQVVEGDDNGGIGSGSQGAMDDMLWGAVMGFFWPIGCAMWLRREEGVWSWRKGVAISIGVAVNAAFGAMRIMG